MSNIYSIYKATNTVNGKCYIGFTGDKWPERQKEHYRLAYNKKWKIYNSKFYRAIRKYGKDIFQWEILYQSLDKIHCLSEMEPYFINQYNSFHKGIT